MPRPSILNLPLRLSIYLDADLDRRLSITARRLGLSRSAIVRRALDHGLHQLDHATPECPAPGYVFPRPRYRRKDRRVPVPTLPPGVRVIAEAV